MDRVLIIDDSRISRVRLRKLLEAARTCDVVEAGTAGEGSDQAAESWDMVFCDLLLPDRDDGFNFVLELQGQLKEGTPLVVYSANAMPDVKAQADAAGCAGYLEKPVQPGSLKELLESL
jgi:CheY-like chemotaxis protein